MATIIDFFPAANDADSFIKNAKSIPEKLLIPVTSASIDNDRQAGYTFSSGQPDLLFICEYYTLKGFAGVIVAWENYYGASHYSVYKRAKLSASADWKRILVIDSTTMQRETAQFLPYINNTLKIPMTADQGYCMMDSDVTLDNIYEYRIVAGFFPTSESFHYDVILSSKSLTKAVGPLATDTIDTLAQSVFGTPDYAWILSLCNRNLYFFSQNASTQKVVVALQGSYFYAPNDINDIARLFVESVYYFGLVKTISNVLSSMNPSGNALFFQAVTDCFDEKSKTFSFRSLNTRLAAAYGGYGKILANAANKVGTSGFTVFSYDDIVGFDSLGKLSQFILQLKTIFINVMYAGKLTVPR